MAARSMVRMASAARSAEASAAAMGQLFVAREIGELRHLALEVERHGADGAVALLGDENVGDVADLLAMLLPALDAFVELIHRFVSALLGLAALVIVLLAVDEHDDVGILLDRAGFAQVGELWPLVLALLDRARELRERQNRNVQLLGYAFQAARDLRQLLDAVLAAAGADRADQL